MRQFFVWHGVAGTGSNMRKLAAFVLLFAVLGICKDHARDSSEFIREYHSQVPLGAERIDLRPSKRSLYLLATAESPGFEGWHGPDDGHVLFTSNGSKVRAYPQNIKFRLTATAMRPDLLLINDPYGTLSISDAGINNYLLNLRFRLIIFHGLEMTYVDPGYVRLIGMPAQVSYDERIFEMDFALPHLVPISDRMILEVLSPTGYRVCKFHLDLI